MEKKIIHLDLKKSDGGDLTIVASDETLDRYNEVVPLDAWDLKNFKKNPVLLVNHDYRVENVVGRAKNLKLSENALTFTPDFHSITQLARDVAEMVHQGVLRTVSVGFLPHAPAKDGDRPSNELLEISFVPVPANPSAMALALKDINDIQKKEIEEWVEKEKSMEIQKPEKEDKNLIEELVDLKEGRVLSGKSRKKIEDGLSALQQAVSALEELLQATDPNDEKNTEEPKGRDPKEEHGKKPKPKPYGKERSSVVRALQGINRETNDLLRKLK